MVDRPAASAEDSFSIGPHHSLLAGAHSVSILMTAVRSGGFLRSPLTPKAASRAIASAPTLAVGSVCVICADVRTDRSPAPNPRTTIEAGAQGDVEMRRRRCRNPEAIELLGSRV